MSNLTKGWYLNTKPVFNSGFEDDEFWAYGQSGFNEVLESYLGSNVLIYDKTLHKRPKEVRAIIQNATNDVFNSTVVRQILCNIGILHCGQYVKDRGLIWLVCTMPDNNRIYEKALLWKCRHTIRFISPITGLIVSYPVYSTNSTQYGTGESVRTNIAVGEDQHLIYLPYNEETIMLNDHFRFIMDKNKENPSVYRITRVDPVSYAVGYEQFNDGLIQWSVQETQFNEETDSKEHMVADYYPTILGDTDHSKGVDGSLTLTDLDGDYTLAIGETKQIRVGCVLPDEETETDLPDDYTLEYDLADGAAAVESVEDNVITIRAEKNKWNVGKSVTIHAASESLNSEADIQIRIVNW